MKRLFTPSILCLAASVLLATSVSAQCLSGDAAAPGGHDPLVGQWAFHWESETGDTGGLPAEAAGIGTFDVQRSATTNLLTVNGNMTINSNGRVYRLAATGTRQRGPLAQYQCIPGTDTIQGGTLHLSDGSLDTLWQFVFKDNNFDEIYMVDQEFLNPGLFVELVLRGNAVKFNSATQTANCLAVGATNPNNVMQTNPITGGATAWWSLQTQSVGLPIVVLSPAAGFLGAGGTAAIGDLVFSNSNRPGLTGTVTTATSAYVNGSSFTRLALTAGSYLVNNCNNIAMATFAVGNGGNMSLEIGPYAVQYEYVFADNNLSTAFLLSTVATRNGQLPFAPGSLLGADILYGTLNRWN